MNVRLCSVPPVRRSRGVLAQWSVAFLIVASFLLGVTPSAFAQNKSLPGTIQAEDFDNGLINYAYWDSTSGNAGGQYRSSDVDIEACSEGGYNVGYIAPGEWLSYTINVTTAGTYTFDFRVAAVSGGFFHVESKGAN